MEKKFVEGQKGDDITPFDGTVIILWGPYSLTNIDL